MGDSLTCRNLPGLPMDRWFEDMMTFMSCNIFLHFGENNEEFHRKESFCDHKDT